MPITAPSFFGIPVNQTHLIEFDWKLILLSREINPSSIATRQRFAGLSDSRMMDRGSMTQFEMKFLILRKSRNSFVEMSSSSSACVPFTQSTWPRMVPLFSKCQQKSFTPFGSESACLVSVGRIFKNSHRGERTHGYGEKLFHDLIRMVKKKGREEKKKRKRK